MFRRTAFALVALLISSFSFAQNNANQSQLPRLVRFSGTMKSSGPLAGVTFALYREQEGGSPLWLETQNVSADASGQYSVLLGSASADGLPADLFSSNEARWLGVKVEGQEEQPRVLLVSVPYALKSGDAQTLGGLPASAFALAQTAGAQSNTPSATPALLGTAQARAFANSITPNTSTFTANFIPMFTDSSGDLTNSNIFQQTAAGVTFGYLGFGGVTSPIEQITSTGNLRLQGGTTHAVVFVGNTSDARFGQDNVGAFFASDTADKKLTFYTKTGTGPLTPRMTVTGPGNVGIGTATPANLLTVTGTVESTSGGFKFPDGSTQTSAAVGSLTGVTAGTDLTGGGSSGTVTLNVDTTKVVTGVTAGSGLAGGGTGGNVSLGTDFTAVQARVTGSCSSGTALGSIASNGTVSCNTVSGGGGSLTLPFSGTGADNPPDAQGTFKVMDTTNGPAPGQSTPDPATIPAAVMGVSQGTGINTGVLGVSTGLDGVAIIGVNTGTVGDETPVVAAFSLATSGKTTLYDGEASSTSARGIELNFAVTPLEVFSAKVGTTDNDKTSLFLVDGSGNVTANGTIQANSDIDTNATVNAVDMNATGTITVQTLNATNINAPNKHFKIDDPMDPAHKWLYHNSIESSDMKDLYDGLVELDKHGEAWVTMPAWFQALNRDFRYQLTAVGAPGPKLYIAQEVSGNRFKIAGGKRGMKVSWMVTGIRQDAWAADNRTQVEQDKQGAEIGAYYHPRNVTSANSPDANAQTTPLH